MDEKRSGKFELRLGDEEGEVAYLRLPTYPARTHCKMSKTVRLHDLVGAYNGPDINLDFDETGTLVGIEVLA